MLAFITVQFCCVFVVLLKYSSSLSVLIYFGPEHQKKYQISLIQHSVFHSLQVFLSSDII